MADAESVSSSAGMLTELQLFVMKRAIHSRFIPSGF